MLESVTMKKEEYRLNVLTLKGRFEYLNLTYEQAEKVYLHEKEKRNHSEQHFFSTWEELDFDLSLFRVILNKKQFQDFEKRHNECIRNHEKSLIENDTLRTNDIKYNNELIHYCSNEFLPHFLK